MSLFNVYKIATQGMTAQRERLEAAAANLANANTTRTPAGGPYRRRDTIFEAVPVEQPGAIFDTVFARNLDTFADEELEAQPRGVQASTRLADASEIVKRYQPNHPDADASGMVALPAVDPLEETVNIMSAARSFEANATAFNTAKELSRASLRLGDNG
ncbi:MAG: flagellar basal body rod protein FlgC [Acidobacteria bacterium]|nr:flagellar basal body rod protein FlgC [Acidobacteriota bacterium]MBI3427001.1 flagellar basal body rod protein FlgC [Acidobacteriota bacterium]